MKGEKAVQSHNAQLKAQLEAEAEETARKTLELNPVGKAVLVTLTLLLVAFAGWRVMTPAFQFERPPATVEISDLREQKLPNSSNYELVAQVKNAADREVTKAVFQVTYTANTPPSQVYLVATDIKPGQSKEVRIAVPTLTSPQSTRKVVPFSVEWVK